MATQHVSIWQDDYVDLSHVLKIEPSPDTNNVISSDGIRLIINTATRTPTNFFYNGVRTANADIYQNENGYANYQFFGGTNQTGENAQARMQSFVATSANTYGISLVFYRSGTPTDDIVVELCDDAAGTNVIASKTLTGATVASGSATGVVFGDTPTVVGNTYYVVMRRTGPRDTVNFWNVQGKVNSAYTAGALYGNNEGTWSVTTADATFRVFGSDLYDMSNGREFYWVVDLPASTINSSSNYTHLFEMFDKNTKTYNSYFTTAIAAAAGRQYWRVSCETGRVVVSSSTDNVTWSTQWTGGPMSMTTSQLQNFNMRFGYGSTNGSIYAIDSWSYGTRETIATQGIKRWNGTAWSAHPVKYWDGTTWVHKPVKTWDGTSWKTPTY